MYHLLVKLMVLAALSQFGMNLADVRNCRSKQCLRAMEQRSREVLTIEWKAISVFPEEAKRFRGVAR